MTAGHARGTHSGIMRSIAHTCIEGGGRLFSVSLDRWSEDNQFDARFHRCNAVAGGNGIDSNEVSF